MKLEIDLECPSCKKQFLEKIENIRPGQSKQCPHCQALIKYASDDVSKIQKSLDSFERSFERFKKTLTIKL